LHVLTTSNADLGVFLITVVVTEYWSNVSITQSFTLTIACVRQIDQFDFILPVLYYTADPTINVPIPVYSLNPNSCPYELLYSATLADGSALPNAITFQATSGSESF
jgi:large repetitive protein